MAQKKNLYKLRPTHSSVELFNRNKVEKELLGIVRHELMRIGLKLHMRWWEREMNKVNATRGIWYGNMFPHISVSIQTTSSSHHRDGMMSFWVQLFYTPCRSPIQRAWKRGWVGKRHRLHSAQYTMPISDQLNCILRPTTDRMFPASHSPVSLALWPPAWYSPPPTTSRSDATGCQSFQYGSLVSGAHPANCILDEVCVDPLFSKRRERCEMMRSRVFLGCLPSFV